MASACLLGVNCKYNGGNNENKELIECLKQYDVIAVCPEVKGGLSTPRACAEIQQDKIITTQGEDVSASYKKGAQYYCDIAIKEDVDFCVLQSRSPSCGVMQIYDGTFSGTLISGSGIFAQMLMEKGVKVIDVEEFMKEAHIYVSAYRKDEKQGV